MLTIESSEAAKQEWLPILVSAAIPVFGEVEGTISRILSFAWLSTSEGAIIYLGRQLPAVSSSQPEG
jgi:hypothetical protein